MAAAIAPLVMEMEKRNTFLEHAVDVAATVIVRSVPAQEKKNVSFAEAPRKESALPVMVMENVMDATEADSVVINVTDTAIEIVSIAMMANVVFAAVILYVRPAVATEQSVITAKTNVHPVVPSPNNRQV